MSSVDNIHNTNMSAYTLATRCILKFHRDTVCGHFPRKLIRKVLPKKKRARDELQVQDDEEEEPEEEMEETEAEVE